MAYISITSNLNKKIQRNVKMTKNCLPKLLANFILVYHYKKSKKVETQHIDQKEKEKENEKDAKNQY